MFLHLSVILFTVGGGVLLGPGSVPLGPGGVEIPLDTPPDTNTHTRTLLDTHTPGPPWTHTPWTPPTFNKRAVRNLLECFLV